MKCASNVDEKYMKCSQNVRAMQMECTWYVHGIYTWAIHEM